MAAEVNGKSPTAQRMLKFAFNLVDDGLMGQQVFAGEATRLAYMTDEAVEGRDAFLEKRDPDWSPLPLVLLTAMTPVSLRPLTDEEYAGYRALAVAKTAAELVRGRGMTPEAAQQRAEDGLPQTLADLLAVDGASMSRVLGDGGDPVGWLWLGTAPTAGDGLWVFDMEIDEPHRGQGLGRATMLAAEDVARDGGAAVAAAQRLRHQHDRDGALPLARLPGRRLADEQAHSTPRTRADPRTCAGLTAPTGDAVLTTLVPALAAALDGAGPALLPLPTGGGRGAVLGGARPDAAAGARRRGARRADVGLDRRAQGRDAHRRRAAALGPGDARPARRRRASGCSPCRSRTSPGSPCWCGRWRHAPGRRSSTSTAASRWRRSSRRPRGWTTGCGTTRRSCRPSCGGCSTPGADLSSYDAVLVGGAALSPTLHDAAVAAGVRVVTTYGMSETCGGCVYDGEPLDGVDVAPAGRRPGGARRAGGLRGLPAAAGPHGRRRSSTAGT